MNIEYLMYPLLINNLPRIKTGNIYVDTCIFGILGIIVFIYNNKNISKKINKKLVNYFFPSDKSTITFKNEGKERSIKFKALMHFLHKDEYKMINKIRERTNYHWNRDDEYVENKDKGYDVDQEEKFKFSKDIYGKIYEEVKERSRRGDNTEYQDIYTLEVFSKTLNLNELEKWISDQCNIYQKYLKQRISDRQMLFTVSWDKKHSSIEIEDNEWDCYASFDNTYFRDKKDIISKIDFFLNNEEWYRERGIPYNLGILLYGEPGGGKSRFIKQIINYTKRHALDIKLNDGFDFDALRNLIQNETIDSDHIIEQKKRIIIFEDIDAVGDTLKDRNLKEKEKDTQTKAMMESLNKMTKKSNNYKENNKKVKDSFVSVTSSDTCESNNNLSYFLNMIDGLNECNGRIMIMTTNRVQYLDKALIRPGRIDIKIKCGKCSIEDIDGMLRCFYKDNYTFTIQDIRTDIDDKYTSAEVTNILRSSRYFNEIKHHFVK
jgi:SpoVK/Ycf46/Vps4 family AAA+-type ATPase